MCGIVGYNGFNNARNILINGLKKLEYRGYDSAGIALMKGEKLSVFKSPGKLENLTEKVKNIIDFLLEKISSYNKDGRNAAWAFAEASGSL